MASKYFKKESIISAVIAALLFYIFIGPIIDFFWNLIVLFSDNVYEGFVDHMYVSAALGNRDVFSALTFTIIVSLSLGFIVSIEVVDYIIIPRLKRGKDSISKSSIFTLRIVRSLCGFIAIIGSLSIFSIRYVDFQVNTSFWQRLDALAPYISEQTEEILRSRWALMKSRNDYVEINNELERIAKKQGIELPTPLIK